MVGSAWALVGGGGFHVGQRVGLRSIEAHSQIERTTKHSRLARRSAGASLPDRGPQPVRDWALSGTPGCLHSFASQRRRMRPPALSEAGTRLAR
jgi:hypothetical protein